MTATILALRQPPAAVSMSLVVIALLGAAARLKLRSAAMTTIVAALMTTPFVMSIVVYV